jgi:hypothetical protein
MKTKEEIKKEFFDFKVGSEDQETVNLVKWPNTVLYNYWDEMLKKPASESHHSSYRGGLAKHTYNVLKIGKSLMKLPLKERKIEEEKFLFLCLIHDLGKIDCYEVCYGERGEEQFRHRKGAMDHVFHTILRLQHLKIHLNEEGMNALVHHHGGWSIDTRGRGNQYAILLHCADMLAVRLEEGE